MRKLQLRRGEKANLPTLAEGEPGWCSDTGQLFVGTQTGNKEVGAAKADKTEVALKADKVNGATAGNFAGLDAAGNLTDSGKKAADFVGKLNTAKAGNLAALAADGGLADSGATVAGIIAQALASGLKLVQGSYTGTGKYGTSNKTTLTFGITAYVVFIAEAGDSAYGNVKWAYSSSNGSGFVYSTILLRGGTVSAIYGNYNLNTTFTDDGLSFYSTAAIGQLNASGKTYNYFAIGM